MYLVADRDKTSATVEQTHITVDLSPRTGFTYDDTSSSLVYQGKWTHASNQSWTAGDYKGTESYSNTAGDSVSVTFTGTAIRLVAPKDSNHGIADIYLDGTLVASIDTYAPSKLYQVVLYDVYVLSAGTSMLSHLVTGPPQTGSSDRFFGVD